MSNSVTDPATEEQGATIKAATEPVFSPVDKGKGKAVQSADDGMDDDDDDDDDGDDEEDDEEVVVGDDDAEMDENELADLEEEGVDPADILPPGSRRSAKVVDYTSEEALEVAGLSSANGEAHDDEDEFREEPMDA